MYKITQQYPRKLAFITGAASGLGKALAMLLAKDGWTLGLADIDLENLEGAAREVGNAGGSPQIYHFDVSDYAQFQQQADKFLLLNGGIDLLFNNAGVGDGGLFEEYSIENYEWMIRVNQMSVVHGCHIFIPVFKKQRSGHILNTASIAAVSCAPTMGAYNLTKAAVVAISETLYGELYDYQVNVSCIMPSYFRTNIAKGSRGGEFVKKSTQYLLDKSNLEAPFVADEILQRAAKKELYLILPARARKMAWLKRLAPMYFRKRIKDDFIGAMRRIKTKIERGSL
jgi:short-subunit dehydrogenase